MLEMQRLAPEMRKLQQQHRNDRQKLNEEMMKLYQEHKVNPMASCLPLLAQMPVFIIMFRILHGLTYKPIGAAAAARARRATRAPGRTPAELGFIPRYISHTSDLYQSLFGQTEMMSFGLDLAKSPAQALSEGFGTGLVYALLVVALGRAVLRAAADGRRPRRRQPDDVAGAAEADAVPAGGVRRLPGLLPAGLVIYYMAQAVLRIAQQAYITRRFYGHDESLGRQAQRASEQARELAKTGRWRRRAVRPGQARAAAGRQATARRRRRGRRPTPATRRRTGRRSARRRRRAADADRQGRAAPTPRRRTAGWSRARAAASDALTAPDGAGDRHPAGGRGTEWMMEWVETTARTVEEAKELALDQLGVVADDAEFEVLAEPKQGLFGRMRGEARVRARVRPTPVRPKQERRRGRRKERRRDAEPTRRRRRRGRRPTAHERRRRRSDRGRPACRGRARPWPSRTSAARPASRRQRPDGTIDDRRPADRPTSDGRRRASRASRPTSRPCATPPCAFVGGLTDGLRLRGHGRCRPSRAPRSRSASTATRSVC